jgi:hypothetical protein
MVGDMVGLFGVSLSRYGAIELVGMRMLREGSRKALHAGEGQDVQPQIS